MINYIRKKVCIPYFDKRYGNERLRYVKEVSHILNADSQSIVQYQKAAIRQLLEHAVLNVPYYRDLYRKHSFDVNSVHHLDDFLRVPCISKEDIREHNDAFVSSCSDVNSLIKTGTGGTTSSPISLYYTRECFSKKQACTLYFFKWFGYDLGDKVALLWGAEQDFPKKKSIKREIINWLTKRFLMLPSSYLNAEIMEGYYRQLLQYKPRFLQAYPTPLYIFSQFLDENGYSLDIPSINVTAEFLYDYQRETIERVFKTKIFNWYGARELGHVGTECRAHNGMHINAYGVYVEVLKNDVPVFDEEGEIVVTDLLNFSMPLIRYKIGDVGVISRRSCLCGCQLPILECVGGRYVDTFKKRDGAVIPGVAFTNRIIKDCDSVKELQVIQKDYELFQLNVVKGEMFNECDIESLKEAISSFMHCSLDFNVQFLNVIPREISGKVRFCKSEV